jgi:hypothetical protein
MTGSSRVAVAALAAAFLAAPEGAGAVEGGLGAYLLGSRDSLAGIAPPPGDYFTTDLIYIDGDAPVLAIGGVALTEVSSSAWIVKLNATHSFADTLWGARPVVTATLPVVTSDLTFQARSRTAFPAASRTPRPASAI